MLTISVDQHIATALNIFNRSQLLELLLQQLLAAGREVDYQGHDRCSNHCAANRNCYKFALAQCLLVPVLVCGVVRFGIVVI